MSGIPLIEEFRGLLKGYYRLALNVTEPTIFFSIIVITSSKCGMTMPTTTF